MIELKEDVSGAFNTGLKLRTYLTANFSKIKVIPDKEYNNGNNEHIKANKYIVYGVTYVIPDEYKNSGLKKVTVYTGSDAYRVELPDDAIEVKTEQEDADAAYTEAISDVLRRCINATNYLSVLDLLRESSDMDNSDIHPTHEMFETSVGIFDNTVSRLMKFHKT